MDENVNECKLMILGNNGVGKTSLFNRFINGYYGNNTISFMGVKRIVVDEKLVEFRILDVDKDQNFKSGNGKRLENNNIFYKSKDAFIIVFDVTNKSSFDNIQNWIRDIDMFCNKLDKDDIVIVIVGTKKDLDEQRMVDYELANKYACEQNMPYFEIGTKDSNVDDIFMKIFRRMKNKNEIYPISRLDQNASKNSLKRSKCYLL